MSTALAFADAVHAHAADLAAPANEVKGGEKVAFWILAPIALGGAIGMVLARNAIHSALFLVCTMLSLGVFYVINAGPFLGMVQIIVYTGAIMILFLFVLMLVGRDSSDSIVEQLRGQRLAAALLGIGLAAMVATGVARAFDDTRVVGLGRATQDGNVPALAARLFTRYVFAFEVTSALLITAALGAMVLAFVERSKKDQMTQRQRSRERVSADSYPAPKPGPGVYATSDSVATPALLPDGTTTDKSVSKVVQTHELDAATTKAKG
ncbi:MAG: NADH-quinone oxidoreductase subunit J [Corynebacteriales bacterium]|nr:NADH-quinone oxidoreductase subunit J [Mycobacteriales bacterium]